jgi:serine/threonine-protein kinase
VGQLIGRRIGNFEIADLIGAGAMGAVYLARHVTLGHHVAVKVMNAPLSASPQHHEQTVQRFTAEARAIAALKNNPHIIKLYDFGELDQGEFYYVMEHLEGHDLERELQRRGRFTVAEALPFLRQICDGLQAAHGQQIIHRDLKPANIFVASSQPPRVKLLDFGLSKRLDSDLRLSVSGATLGTPLFAAPEQVLGEPERIGPHTDVYGLGVIAYLMLSAQMPFDTPSGVSPLSLIRLPLERRPVPLARRKPELPAEVARVVDSCLAREPGDRPASPMAFYLELERVALAAGCVDEQALAAVRTAPGQEGEETLPLETGEGPPPPARDPSSLRVAGPEARHLTAPLAVGMRARTVALILGLGSLLLVAAIAVIWWGGGTAEPLDPAVRARAAVAADAGAAIAPDVGAAAVKADPGEQAIEVGSVRPAGIRDGSADASAASARPDARTRRRRRPRRPRRPRTKRTSQPIDSIRQPVFD